MLRRKGFALFIVLAMLFSMVGTAFAAPTDIDGHAFKDAILKAYEEGVLEGREDGKFYPNDTLDRAEAAKVAARLLGYDDAACAAAALEALAFSDADIWARGCIKIAAMYEIVRGVGGGLYNPYGPLNMNEWAAILIRLMGLDSGLTWPAGYDELAAELGLFLGFTYNGNTAITRGQMAQTLTNYWDQVAPKTALQGYVVEEIKGEFYPVAGVKVTDGALTATTDVNGFYTLPTTPGFKEVTASKAGYFDGVLGDSEWWWWNDIAAFSNKHSAANFIALELYDKHKLGIEGRVVDAVTGEDVTGVKVTLQEKVGGVWKNMARVTLGCDGTFGFYNKDAEATAHNDQWFYDYCGGEYVSRIDKDTEYRVVVEKCFLDENFYNAMKPINHVFTTSAQRPITKLGLLEMTPVKAIKKVSVNVSWGTGATIPADGTEVTVLLVALAPDGVTPLEIVADTAVKTAGQVKFVFNEALTIPTATYYVWAWDWDNAVAVEPVNVVEGVDPVVNVTMAKPMTLEIKAVLGEWHVNPADAVPAGTVDLTILQKVGDKYVYVWGAGGPISVTVPFNNEGEAFFTAPILAEGKTYKVVADGKYVVAKSGERTMTSAPNQALVISDMVPTGYLNYTINFEGTVPDCLKDMKVTLKKGTQVIGSFESAEFYPLDAFGNPGGSWAERPFGSVLHGTGYTLEVEAKGFQKATSTAFNITEFNDTTAVVTLIKVVADKGTLTGLVRWSHNSNPVYWTGTAALYTKENGIFAGYSDIDGQGKYSLTGIEPGLYTLVFRGRGAFETKAINDVAIVAGANTVNTSVVQGGMGYVVASILDTFNVKLTQDHVDVVMYDEWTKQALSMWGHKSYQDPTAVGFDWMNWEHPSGEYRFWGLSASTEYTVMVADEIVAGQPQKPTAYATTTANVKLLVKNGFTNIKIVVPWIYPDLGEVWNLYIKVHHDWVWALGYSDYDYYAGVVAVYDSFGTLVRSEIVEGNWWWYDSYHWVEFTDKEGLPNGTYTVKGYFNGAFVASGTVVIKDKSESMNIYPEWYSWGM